MRSIVSAEFDGIDDAELAAGRVAGQGIQIYKRRIEGSRKHVDEDEPLAGIDSYDEAESLGADSVILGSYPISFAAPDRYDSPEFFYGRKPDVYDKNPRLVLVTDAESVAAVRRILRNAHGREIRDKIIR